MTEHSLFAKRVGLTAVSTFIASLAPIILLSVLTKTTAAEGYGVWIQVTITADILPLLTTLGLTVSMMRLLAGVKIRDEVREGFYASLSMALLSSALVSLTFYFLAEPLASILFDGNTAVATILPAIIFVASFNYVCLGYFRAMQQIKRFAFFTAFLPCCSIVIVSTFVLLGYGISGAVLGLLLAQLLLSFLLAIKIVSELGVALPKFSHARSYLALGLPTVPSNLSYWIVNSSDRYVISIFLGAAAVGYYSPGYTVGYCIVLAVSPVSIILLPTLSAYFENHRIDQVKTTLSYCLKYFLALAIPAAFFLSLLSKQILTVLTTPDIAAQGYAVTPYITASALLFGVYGLVGNVLVLEKRTYVLATIWLLAAVLNLALTLFLVPRIGIIGAAIATLFAFACVFALVAYYARQYVRGGVSIRFALKSGAASLAMSFVIIALNPQGLLPIVLVAALCACIYVILLWILKGIGYEELIFFKNLLRRTT
jgi:O-antigen/teichoic acid export membrane protein